MKMTKKKILKFKTKKMGKNLRMEFYQKNKYNVLK